MHKQLDETLTSMQELWLPI